MIKLSVIIPCYNESKNLHLLVNKCEEVIAQEENIEFGQLSF